MQTALPHISQRGRVVSECSWGGVDESEGLLCVVLCSPQVNKKMDSREML